MTQSQIAASLDIIEQIKEFSYDEYMDFLDAGDEEGKKALLNMFNHNSIAPCYVAVLKLHMEAKNPTEVNQ